MMGEWKVDDKPSMSDHNYVLFDTQEKRNEEKATMRNLKKTDWDLFRTMMCLYKDTPEPQNRRDIDKEGQLIIDEIRKALEMACPETPVGKRRPVPWWNEKLTALRRTAKKLYKKEGKASLEYREAQTLFKKEMHYSQRVSWREFVEKMEGMKESSRLVKILTKGKRVDIGFLRKADGTYTESPEERNTGGNDEDPSTGLRGRGDRGRGRGGAPTEREG